MTTHRYVSPTMKRDEKKSNDWPRPQNKTSDHQIRHKKNIYIKTKYYV